jgi:hypothetical protein
MAKNPVTKTFVRRQVSSAPGTVIDGHLTPEQTKALYGIWLPGWPAKREYRGGIEAITAEMVMDVPEVEFIKAFGRRKVMKERAMDIRKVASEIAER